ncbi:helix-turn-helix transcriptional regulator [Paenibacillus yanchengensis]|uniref:Helix-turn-helix transcriptional regulator n=1 Tax=Paenibacillus yanchengensis TaxID=2035833 RepID=A0ABW4YL27_9BACL
MNLDNLQKFRQSKGISYQKMAQELGITFQSYWMIENGKRGMSYEMAIKIANILETTPDNIFLNNNLTTG